MRGERERGRRKGLMMGRREERGKRDGPTERTSSSSSRESTSLSLSPSPPPSTTTTVAFSLQNSHMIPLTRTHIRSPLFLVVVAAWRRPESEPTEVVTTLNREIKRGKRTDLWVRGKRKKPLQCRTVYSTLYETRLESQMARKNLR